LEILRFFSFVDLNLEDNVSRRIFGRFFRVFLVDYDENISIPYFCRKI